MRWYFLSIMISCSAWSTVTVNPSECPEAFEGKVKEVIASIGPTSSFSTQKVVFENNHTLKGEVNEKVFLDVLENGPFKVEPGMDYRVQLRNGKLCWMEEI